MLVQKDKTQNARHKTQRKPQNPVKKGIITHVK